MMRAVAIIVIVWTFSLNCRSMLAGEPLGGDGLWGTPVTYEILQRPPTRHHKKTQTAEQRVLNETPVRPYAYGWFGPNPSPHWQRQFGYSRSHIQWSLK